jgi:hypothetical protein
MENKNRTTTTNTIIARQSQLKMVLDWSNTCDKCLTLKELVGITNVMVDYVENGYSKEIGDRLDKIQEHLDNKKQVL